MASRAPRGQARERLLSTSADLFYDRGIQAVSVDVVAEQSGVTKRTVYYHFAGKDALLAAALDARGEAWRSWLDAELDRRSKTPAGQLLAMFDVLAEESASSSYRGCRFVNAAAELPDPAHPARAVASAHKAAVLALITRRVALVDVADEAELARQLKILLEGAITTALVDPGAQPAQDARHVAAILLGIDGQERPTRSRKGT